MNKQNILIDHLYHNGGSKNCKDLFETSQDQLKNTCVKNEQKNNELILEQPNSQIENDTASDGDKKSFGDTTKKKYTFLKVPDTCDQYEKYSASSEECPVDEDYALLVHDDKILFSCRHCELAYDNYVSLKDHSAVEHGAILQRKDCQHCFHVLSSHQKLLLHLKDQHLKDLSPDQAEKLKKKFPQDYSSNSLFCDKCKKAFSSKASLLTHLKKFHTKSTTLPKKVSNLASNSLECFLCSITFSSPKELQLHQETTHNTRTYFCLECDSSFKSRSSLNHHNICHHRVHRCTSCLTLFHGRFALTNHVKHQHPGMPVYRADRWVSELRSE